jgi:hypothetical protein
MIYDAQIFKEKGDQMLLNEHYNEALKFYSKALDYLSEFDPDYYLDVKYLQ